MADTFSLGFYGSLQHVGMDTFGKYHALGVAAGSLAQLACELAFLSHQFAQMLAVGRSLMSKPQLLMMDEPSLGLAPIIVKSIFEILKEINKNGVSVLLIEQNAKAALEISDYAYVLETGTVVLEGPGKELITNDQVRKAYLGA